MAIEGHILWGWRVARLDRWAAVTRPPGHGRAGDGADNAVGRHLADPVSRRLGEEQRSVVAGDADRVLVPSIDSRAAIADRPMVPVPATTVVTRFVLIVAVALASAVRPGDGLAAVATGPLGVGGTAQPAATNATTTMLTQWTPGRRVVDAPDRRAAEGRDRVRRVGSKSPEGMCEGFSI